MTRLVLEDVLHVKCDSCGAQAWTSDGMNPDGAVECGCCPEDHDHAGRGCRTVTVTATAYLAGSAGE